MLRLGRGAIIELDASEDDDVNILANNLLVAKGKVAVNGNRVTVSVSENCWRGRSTCAEPTRRVPDS
jgi:flagellar motor switch protein FliN